MMIRMPVPSSPYVDRGSVSDTNNLSLRLQEDVRHLALEIGERHVHRPEALNRAADWIETSLANAGMDVVRQAYTVEGVECFNIEGTWTGREREEEIILIGAHYDSVPGCPGANDNGSGVAALLALARTLASQPHARTLRCVAFVNEEPPYFHTGQMGSVIYAKACRARGDQIQAMFSLETMGYFTDEPDSQQYPFPLSLAYPSRGNFLAFVGNFASRHLVRRVVAAFRSASSLPAEGAALPASLPGVGWSDQWSFWQEGYPALMVTDTAPFRYPEYHASDDLPDKMDFKRLASGVEGLTRVILPLLDEKPD